jgi:16S rRNA A1518/A1519 N6-dimethyltransferase RsmA/KsgA/DIM1 with predicted DNA glycosylase/AP lyase activity
MAKPVLHSGTNTARPSILSNLTVILANPALDAVSPAPLQPNLVMLRTKVCGTVFVVTARRLAQFRFSEPKQRFGDTVQQFATDVRFLFEQRFRLVTSQGAPMPDVQSVVIRVHALAQPTSPVTEQDELAALINRHEGHRVKPALMNLAAHCAAAKVAAMWSRSTQSE